MSILADPPRLMTPDEFLQIPDGNRYDLIEGVLKERHMGAISVNTAATLVTLLGTFNREHRLGWVFQDGVGYRCFPGRQRTIRFPDLSFIRFGRIPDERLPEGWLEIPPDLAVEVVSPNDGYYEVDEKINDYLDAGVRLIWVINPDAHVANVYRHDRTCVRLRADDSLDGGDVVPGFACRLGDIFPPMPPSEPAV